MKAKAKAKKKTRSARKATTKKTATKKKAARKKTTKPKGHADGVPVWCSFTRVVPIESVTPNPRNPNEHPDDQVKLLAKIIKGAGWRNPIVVSNQSGFITKGHCRLYAATLLGVSAVPIDEQDYASPDDEYADLLADNRLAELSDRNDAAVAEILADFDPDFDKDLTGFLDVDIEALLEGTDIDPPDPDPDPGGGTASTNESRIVIQVPDKYYDPVIKYLANGEQTTPSGLGQGVLKLAGLKK